MNRPTEESARAMDEWLRTVERDEDAREDLNQWIERYFSKAKMKRGKESPNGLVLTEEDHKELRRLERKLEEASMRRRNAWVRVEETRLRQGTAATLRVPF